MAMTTRARRGAARDHAGDAGGHHRRAHRPRPRRRAGGPWSTRRSPAGTAAGSRPSPPGRSSSTANSMSCGHFCSRSSDLPSRARATTCSSSRQSSDHRSSATGDRRVAAAVLDPLVAGHPLADGEADLVDDVAVRGHLAADHRETQAPAGLEHDPRPVAGHRAEREHDPGGPGPDGLLHDHGHLDVQRVDAPCRGRSDSARPVKTLSQQRRTWASTSVGAADVDLGLELAGEAGARRVLGGRAGADGDAQVADADPVAQRLVLGGRPRRPPRPGRSPPRAPSAMVRSAVGDGTRVAPGRRRASACSTTSRSPDCVQEGRGRRRRRRRTRAPPGGRRRSSRPGPSGLAADRARRRGRPARRSVRV